MDTVSGQEEQDKEDEDDRRKDRGSQAVKPGDEAHGRADGQGGEEDDRRGEIPRVAGGSVCHQHHAYRRRAAGANQLEGKAGPRVVQRMPAFGFQFNPSHFALPR